MRDRSLARTRRNSRQETAACVPTTRGSSHCRRGDTHKTCHTSNFNFLVVYTEYVTHQTLTVIRLFNVSRVKIRMPLKTHSPSF